MTPAARLAAAVEVLAEVEVHRRPAAQALKDWGLARRFAGAKDRAAVASLLYDALRRRASAAWIMAEATPRAILLGTLRLARGLDAAAIAALCTGERHGVDPLSAEERRRLDEARLGDAPASVAGDVPDWIEPSLRRAFGEDCLAEAQALAQRAPIDLRTNTLLANRDGLRRRLAHLAPEATPYAPAGLRLWPGEDGRGPALQSEPEFVKGWFEIQDEGSQLAALLSGARPGEQVVDLCAGAGGKTLALAALMQNRGQIYATDRDLRRLAPIHDRLRRAGVRNVQVRTPRGGSDPVGDLDGAADLVFVDAPCTGSGTWRRNPDAKWRLRRGSLDQRRREQAEILHRAAGLVKSSGRIAYVTCSVLPEENDEAVQAFLETHQGFTPDTAPSFSPELPAAFWGAVRRSACGLQMSPQRTGTDGFYVAIIRRA